MSIHCIYIHIHICIYLHYFYAHPLKELNTLYNHVCVPIYALFAYIHAVHTQFIYSLHRHVRTLYTYIYKSSVFTYINCMYMCTHHPFTSLYLPRTFHFCSSQFGSQEWLANLATEPQCIYLMYTHILVIYVYLKFIYMPLYINLSNI